MPTLGGRASLVALVVFGALLLLPGLGRLAAFDSTDARYLEVSREMDATGDLVVPRLAGVEHLDKPPLTYWAALAGFRLFGVGEFGGRFFEQVVVLATALLLARYGRRWLGPQAGLAAALVFLTSGLVFVTSRALSTDLFQLFFLTWAMLACYDAAVARSPGRTVLAFSLLGVSMLSKGPIAILVALCVLLPFLVLARGRASLPVRGVLVGALVFVGVGLPWYAVLVHRDPELLDYFVTGQLLSRVAGGGVGHVHGPGFLPAAWVLGFLPWTPLVTLALWRLRPRAHERRCGPLPLYLFLWSVVPVALFSLFATKLPTYILPAFPPAALALAHAGSAGLLDDAWGRRAGRAGALTMGVVALVLAAALGVFALTGHTWLGRQLEYGQLSSPGAFAAALGFAAAVAPALACALAVRSPASGLPLLAVYAAAVFGLGFHAVAPGLSTARAVAALVRSVPDARLVEYGGFFAGPLFYTQRLDRFHLAAVKRFDSVEGRPPPQPNLALSHDRAMDLLREDTPTFLYLNERKLPGLELPAGTRTVWSGRRHVLLANPAALRAGGGPTPLSP